MSTELTADEITLYRDTPIWKLFLKCSVPSVISSIIWAVCSITDSVFVGQLLGAEALAAVNLAWPLMMIATAVSDMIATGASVRASISLGENDGDAARRVFTRSVIWTILIGFAFMLMGLFLADPIMGVIGAEGEVRSMASLYFLTFALFAPLSLLFFATDNYLRICGKMNYSMYVNIFVAVLNIILDALFLMVFHWDVWAAALATSISLAVGSVLSIVPFISKKLSLYFVRGRVSLQTLWNVMYNGSSDFFTSVSGAVFMIFANWVLLGMVGDMGVTAFGIVMEINSIAQALFGGMAFSMQPALSYNHGANNGKRLFGICKILFICTSAISAVLCLMTWWKADWMVMMFINGEPEVFDMAVNGMMIFAITYLLSWFATNTNMILTSVDRPGQSLIIGILSGMIIPIIMMALMSPWGLNGVWWSLVVSTVLSTFVSLALMIKLGHDGEFRMTPDSATA